MSNVQDKAKFTDKGVYFKCFIHVMLCRCHGKLTQINEKAATHKEKIK